VNRGTVSVDQTLNMPVTLYKDTKKGEFIPKQSKFIVKEVFFARVSGLLYLLRFLSSFVCQLKKKTVIGMVELDLSVLATPATHAEVKVFQLGKPSSSPPLMRVTIGSRFLGEGTAYAPCWWIAPDWLADPVFLLLLFAWRSDDTLSTISDVSYARDDHAHDAAAAAGVWLPAQVCRC
jgi:hypothetical protein